MINYVDREHTLKLITIEKSSLKSTLSIQQNLNKQILTFMKNFVGSINIELDSNSKVYKYIDKSTNALKKSNRNISNLESLIKKLNSINKDIENYTSEDKIKEKIEKYNTAFSKNIDNIYINTSLIEMFIHDISLIDLSDLLSNEKTTVTNNNSSDNSVIETQELNNSFIENTLIISDIRGKVILPYKLEKIKEILLNEKEKYSSIEDVIEKKYTIPLKNYKIASISRFREAYKLVIKKEHGSRLKALSLAIEMFSTYNLHPAIITACNSLDELDIYLACLDDNTLDDFKYFNIKYEIAPTTSDNTYNSLEKV